MLNEFLPGDDEEDESSTLEGQQRAHTAIGAGAIPVASASTRGVPLAGQEIAAPPPEEFDSWETIWIGSFVFLKNARYKAVDGKASVFNPRYWVARVLPLLPSQRRLPPTAAVPLSRAGPVATGKAFDARAVTHPSGQQVRLKPGVTDAQGMVRLQWLRETAPGSDQFTSTSVEFYEPLSVLQPAPGGFLWDRKAEVWLRIGISDAYDLAKVGGGNASEPHPPAPPLVFPGDEGFFVDDMKAALGLPEVSSSTGALRIPPQRQGDALPQQRQTVPRPSVARLMHQGDVATGALEGIKAVPPLTLGTVVALRNGWWTPHQAIGQAHQRAIFGKVIAIHSRSQREKPEAGITQREGMYSHPAALVSACLDGARDDCRTLLRDKGRSHCTRVGMAEHFVESFFQRLNACLPPLYRHAQGLAKALLGASTGGSGSSGSEHTWVELEWLQPTTSDSDVLRGTGESLWEPACALHPVWECDWEEGTGGYRRGAHGKRLKELQKQRQSAAGAGISSAMFPGSSGKEGNDATTAGPEDDWWGEGWRFDDVDWTLRYNGSGKAELALGPPTSESNGSRGDTVPVASSSSSSSSSPASCPGSGLTTLKLSLQSARNLADRSGSGGSDVIPQAVCRLGWRRWVEMPTASAMKEQDIDATPSDVRSASSDRSCLQWMVGMLVKSAVQLSISLLSANASSGTSASPSFTLSSGLAGAATRVVEQWLYPAGALDGWEGSPFVTAPPPSLSIAAARLPIPSSFGTAAVATSGFALPLVAPHQGLLSPVPSSATALPRGPKGNGSEPRRVGSSGSGIDAVWDGQTLKWLLWGLQPEVLQVEVWNVHEEAEAAALAQWAAVHGSDSGTAEALGGVAGGLVPFGFLGRCRIDGGNIPRVWNPSLSLPGLGIGSASFTALDAARAAELPLPGEEIDRRVCPIAPVYSLPLHCPTELLRHRLTVSGDIAVRVWLEDGWGPSLYTSDAALHRYIDTPLTKPLPSSAPVPAPPSATAAATTSDNSASQPPSAHHKSPPPPPPGMPSRATVATDRRTVWVRKDTLASRAVGV